MSRDIARRVRRGEMSRRLWMEYLAALAGWPVGLVVLAFFAWRLLSLWKWQGTELLYPFLHWARDNLLLLLLFCTLGGWLVISYLFLSRPLVSRDIARRVRRGEMSRRLWMEYLAALAGWPVGLVVLAFFAWRLLSLWKWQGTELLYPFLHWARDNLLLLLLFCTLGGWLVISYLFLSRPLGYLDDLAAAAEQLARPDDTPIQLPPALRATEAQLNLARHLALEEARAAREAEQRKNDLIVYLAHDLKTPLTSVIGYLTLLRDEPDIPPAQRERYTGTALEKAERLEELIDEFFDITRFNLSHLELEEQTVDLTRMLEQIASEFQPALAERGLTCRLDLPPQLPCDCDPDKLARVFDNLLRNACYYSTPDTEVRIRGEVQGDRAVLTFRNAGKTIPQEKLDRIFQQFFRLDSSRATRTGGAGLGLAIAKEIVELHGGAIRADSADGEVSFTVQLPLSARKS